MCGMRSRSMSLARARDRQAFHGIHYAQRITGDSISLYIVQKHATRGKRRARDLKCLSESGSGSELAGWLAGCGWAVRMARRFEVDGHAGFLYSPLTNLDMIGILRWQTHTAYIYRYIKRSVPLRINNVVS